MNINQTSLNLESKGLTAEKIPDGRTNAAISFMNKRQQRNKKSNPPNMNDYPFAPVIKQVKPRGIMNKTEAMYGQ